MTQLEQLNLQPVNDNQNANVMVNDSFNHQIFLFKNVIK